MKSLRAKKIGTLPRRTGSAMVIAAVLVIASFIASCATIGNEFPADKVPLIKIGATTQDEIRSMFGDPWRVGIEDGMRTWTYGLYRYSVFKDAETKDLVIRFGDNNVVKSYTFNTTDTEGIER